MTDTAAFEARIASLETEVRALQEAVLQLQKQIGPTPKPAETRLRSRGMLGSPKPGR
ncbi:hypothetical protein SAMN04488498_113149 [Mesorhizobium albiziae]|uniref:Transposase n=1 Tax=Neomesorhizobium albiziae TaxID=335020 RepID=A0A1I4CL12_9HYPH|nr:GPO family capsid scaffolding protein [Mesorhizobium albiziae]GLS29345.1 hypothetical protein GCM10007937_10530 [Mesorhizobium albiziae]SFK81944.1 hypothetical protein SAMN04488498_113149 [Mesorhizobium albiziae]